MTVSTNASRRIHQELLAAVMAGKRVVELPRDYLPGESTITIDEPPVRCVFRIERSDEYTLAIFNATHTTPSEREQISAALGLTSDASLADVLAKIQRRQDEAQRANKILAAYCPECDPSRSSLTSTVDLLVADVLSEPRSASSLVNMSLARVLVAIDSEAQIVKVETDQTISIQYHGYVTTRSIDGSAVTVTTHAPTHAVVDGDGESIGCGLSANDAIVDAIVRSHESVCKAYDELNAAVRAVQRANAVLDELV